MRTLIYVPIIHTSADLGSMAEHVAKRAINELGQDLWTRHRETVDGFWQVVSDSFETMDVKGVKIYQDGMIADGPVGRQIVEETARAGSQNYQLILKLLERGAVLVKTEDFGLVKKEYDRLQTITRAKTTMQKIIALIQYKWTKTRLLHKRDAFIAQTIDQSLGSDERAILFIGAFHNTYKMLSKDIQILEIKEAAKVKQYQKLLPLYHKHSQQFDDLGRYLVLPIANCTDNDERKKSIECRPESEM